VLGGRRKNKKEEGNVIEEVFKTGSEKDEIKTIYRVYSLNPFYSHVPIILFCRIL
jgi:hypothetical protein